MTITHRGRPGPNDPRWKEGYTITVGGSNVKPEPPPTKKPADKPKKRER